MDVLLWVLAAALVAAGIAGAFLPAIPGALLVFVGLVLAAWADGFVHVGAGTIAILAVLTASTYVLDFVAGALGTRRFGASGRAMIGASIGALVGLFFGIWGIILGPFLGAVAGELTVRRDLRSAGKAGVGAWVGVVVGTLGKVVIVFVMIGVFVVVFLS
jgi:uncharacterized protein YqgC (DUF456 family)